MNVSINPSMTIAVANQRTAGFIHEAEVRRIRRRVRLGRRAARLAAVPAPTLIDRHDLHPTLPGAVPVPAPGDLAHASA